MKFSDAFPSRYLKVGDLDGEDMTAVISKVGWEMLGEDRRLILSFKGDVKPMVCNKTNAKRIALMFGDEEMDNWAGKQITLTAEWTSNPKGEQVQGLRVKPPDKTTKRKIVTQDRGKYQVQSTAPAEEGLDDEIPFEKPAAKPPGIEDMAREAARAGHEVLASIYRHATTEGKRKINEMQAELEALYPKPMTD